MSAQTPTIPPEKDFRKDDETITVECGDGVLVLKAMRWGKLSRCYPLIAEMRKIDRQILDLLRLEQDVEEDVAIMNFQQRLDIIIKVLVIAHGNTSYDGIADQLTLDQAKKLPMVFNRLLEISGFEVAKTGEAPGSELKENLKEVMGSGSTETSAPSLLN